MAKKKTKIVIAYDFDGTLMPGNMQEHKFIPQLGIKKDDFWRDVKERARDHDMNEILAYMQLMLERAKEKKVPITRSAFLEHGKDIPYFEGVEEFFPKINDYAKSKGLEIDHYIISSGLRDILDGTTIRKHFKVVFASAYKFDVNHVAEWPALAIDYTSKTQILFRINKGIDNAWDNTTINTFVKEEARPMPFSRMIYLGDGETDVPAMKMVALQGGTAIAVFNPVKNNIGKKAKATCHKLIEEKRANFIAPADYTEGSSLYRIVQLSIDKIAAEVELRAYTK